MGEEWLPVTTRCSVRYPEKCRGTGVGCGPRVGVNWDASPGGVRAVSHSFRIRPPIERDLRVGLMPFVKLSQGFDKRNS